AGSCTLSGLRELHVRAFGHGASGTTGRRGLGVDGSLVALAFAAAALVGAIQSGYHLQLATDIAMFVALSYSWNLISGFTGYVSLGHVAFLGLGSYVTALLIIHWHWHWLVATLAAGAVAAVVAVPLGFVMLRLK